MTVNFDRFPNQLKEIVRELRNNKTVVEILEERLVAGRYKKFSKWQKEYLDPIFDNKVNFIQQSLVGYPSCGKTTTNAIALVGMMIFSPLKYPVDIRILSPTGQLTDGVLYKEIKRIICAMDLQKCFEITGDKLFIKGDTNNEFGAMHLMKIPNEKEREDSLRGGHSQGIFCQIFDECAKFHDWVFTNCAGNMNAGADEKVVWLCASNLDVSYTGYGYFITHILFTRYSGWNNFFIDIDQEEDPVKKAAILKNSKRYYGEGSDKYNAMLYCKLPSSAGNEIFRYDEIISACSRNHLFEASAGFPCVMGIDVSTGNSGAYTAFCIRNDIAVTILEGEKLLLDDIITKAKYLARKHSVSSIVVDASSNSAIYEMIKKSVPCPVYAFNGANSPTTKGEFNQYANARAEIWFLAAQWFRSDVFFDIPDTIMPLIRAMVYDEDENGILKVISKKENSMKRIIRTNPIAMDMLDAFTMTFYPNAKWYHTGGVNLKQYSTGFSKGSSKRSAVL